MSLISLFLLDNWKFLSIGLLCFREYGKAEVHEGKEKRAKVVAICQNRELFNIFVKSNWTFNTFKKKCLKFSFNLAKTLFLVMDWR